jgi:hypothetical protein
MATTADAVLKNVVVDGMLKDIHEAWKRKSYRATLILIYSAIDAMAHLTMPGGKDKVSRSDFVDWADKRLLFRDATGARTLQLPGLELYAARCALVHTYGSESDLHKDGKVKRQIGYGDEFIPEVAADPNIENLVLVSIRGLVDALSEGVAATLQELAHDEPRRKLFAVRLEKMVQELPATP